LQLVISQAIPSQAFAASMLASVNLDDKLPTAAFEIDHVGQDGGLAAEVKTKPPKLTQADPQLHFLRCHLLA
jgi:hypothetical protein